MKFIKFLFYSLSILFLSTQLSSALTVSKCTSPTVNLNWSSSNCAANPTGGVVAGSGACSFAPSPNGSTVINTANVFAQGGSCTVAYNCQGAGGQWGTEARDTLYVNDSGCVAAQNGLCGNGQSTGLSTALTCARGSVGSKGQQADGSWHWYCDGTGGGATSQLCWSAATPPAPTTCSNGLNINWYPSCTCPAGQVQSGSSCVTPSCSNGLNINWYPSCTCPAGQVQSGSSCINPSCSNGLNYATYGPGCTCPAGQVQSGSSCVGVNGSCGASAGYCSPGNSSGVSNVTGGQSWTCSGTGGGSSASCLVCGTGYYKSGNSCIAHTTSITGSGCTINPGQSSCQATINWTTSNTTSNGWTVTGPGAPAGGYGAATSGTGYPSIPSGSNTFTYNTSPLPNKSVTVTASCGGGSTWNGSSCVCPAGNFIDGTTCRAYSATMSATPSCDILPGRSTCASTVNWTVTSPATNNPAWSVSANNGANPNSTSVTGGIGVSGTKTFDVKNGDTTFTLNTGNNLPATTAITKAKCKDADAAWDGTKCPVTLNLPPTNESEKGKDFTLTWQSNGNTCDLKGYDGTIIKTVTSTNGTFSYTFTAAANPYLNNPGDYKYNVDCYYQVGGDKGPVVSGSTILTVYEKVAAYIDDNNDGTASLGCKGTWKTATLEKNGVIVARYNYANGDRIPNTYSLAGSPSLILTCIGKNTDVATLPKGLVSLTGSVKTGNKPAVSTTTSSDETEIKEITYHSPNGVFDIFYEATGVTNVRAGVVTGDPTVAANNVPLTQTLQASDNWLNKEYRTGATLRFEITKNGVTKTVIMRLYNDEKPNAQLTTLTPTSIVGVCYRSSSYELQVDGSVVKSGNIPNASYDSYTVNYANSMATSSSSQTVKLICTSSGGSDNATGQVVDPNKLAASIIRFSAYPPELACGGGKVILTWEVQYSKNKNCHIETERISKGTMSAADLSSYQTALDTSLNTNSNYKSLVPATVSATKANIFDIVDDQNIAKGQLSNINTKSSTRFKLVCGGVNGIPLSTRTADVNVVCRGQE